VIVDGLIVPHAVNLGDAPICQSAPSVRMAAFADFSQEAASPES